MWEASFTYGGGMDDPSSPTDDAEEGAEPPAAAQGQAAEWYLLSLKFLFRVRDARGGELLPVSLGSVELTTSLAVIE